MNISEILNGTKMNDCITKKECICQKNNSVPKECINETTIEDSKKRVKISLKNNSEKAIVVILDNCLITDNNTKCDALFLYQTKNKKMACQLIIIILINCTKLLTLIIRFPGEPYKCIYVGNPG